MNSNLATGRKSEVGAIIVTDEGRVVGVVADTCACHGVGIAIDGRGS